MLKYRKLSFVLIIGLVTITLTGCWNYQPLKERSIVVAVGLDKGTDDKFELTLQIAKPALIKPDQIIKDNAVTVVSDIGDTVFEAVRSILKKVNRKPYYGHLQLIVIGEKLAKDNIEEILDFFERDHEPRLTPYVIVAKGLSSKEILSAKSEIDYIPAIHIKSTIDNTKSSGKIKQTALIEILKQINYPEYNPIVGVIEKGDMGKTEKVSDMRIEGGAVFKYTKLVGYLNGIETRGLSFVKDEMEGGLLKVKNPLDEEKLVSIEVMKSKSKITVDFENGEPRFTVDIETSTNLGGQQGKGDLTTEDAIMELEREAKNVIKGEVNNVIKKVQNEYKSDVLGFAEVISKKHPEYWEKNKNDWHNTFPDVSVKVNVKVEIKRVGLINRTTEAQ